MNDDEITPLAWFGVFGLVVIICFLVKSCIDKRIEEANCEKGTFTICIGNTKKINVPTCYEYSISNYMFKQYNEHSVVVNKNAQFDVVSFPNSTIISVTQSGCTE